MSKFVIAITGGIACGKSTVANLFANFGIDIVDLDQIAKDITTNNQEVLTKIKDYFGGDIINSTGEINRDKIRKAIFNNKHNKKWLENLLHPLIRKQAGLEIENSTSKYTVLVIPLLTSDNIKYYPIDQVILVNANENLQIKRLQQRDKIDKKLATKILASQPSHQQRSDIADYTIDNAGDIKSLERQVEKIHLQELINTDSFKIQQPNNQNR